MSLVRIFEPNAFFEIFNKDEDEKFSKQKKVEQFNCLVALGGKTFFNNFK